MVNIPSSDSHLTGLIDLSSMMHIDYSVDEMGKHVTLEDIDKQHKLYELALTERERMIE